MRIVELFEPENAYTLHWGLQGSSIRDQSYIEAVTKQGHHIEIAFFPINSTTIGVEFTRNGGMSINKQGDAVAILNTVMQGIKMYLEQVGRPHYITFDATPASRISLYAKMVDRFALGVGYQRVNKPAYETELARFRIYPTFVLKRGTQNTINGVHSHYSFTEGVGRITPQNVTHDVGLNQTSIEAAKFGSKVNRDGYPPLMRSKK